MIVHMDLASVCAILLLHDLTEHLFGGGDYYTLAFAEETSERKRKVTHTVKTSVVGFHKSLLDFSVLDQQGIALAAVVSKDC